MNDNIFFFFYNFAHQSVFLDGVIVFLAVYFPFLVIMVAGLFLLFHHEVLRAENPYRVFLEKKKEILLVFFSGILSWVLAHLFKFFFHLERPIEMLSQVQTLFSKTDYAFPSGHATFFTALALAIYFSHKKAGYLFMFFALLISFARVMAGVHFPVDILGGIILGIFVSFLVQYFYSSQFAYFKKKM